MGGVINAVDEGNLPIESFHSNELPIDDETPTKSLGIAVPGSDIVVMRELLEFPHHSLVRRIETAIDPRRQRADARSFDVEIEERFFSFPAMIDAEPCSAIDAAIPFQTIACAFFAGMETVALLARRIAVRSPFLRVDMLKEGKMASLCYKILF